MKGTEKGYFKASKESDTDLLRLGRGRVTMSSRDNSQVLGKKAAIFQASHERMLHALSSAEDWVNLFICCQEENSHTRGDRNFPFLSRSLQPQQSAVLVCVCRITAQHPWMPPAAAPTLISNEVMLTKGVVLASSRGICS